MRSFIVLSALLVAASAAAARIDATAVCNRDNCLRAVLRSSFAGCSTYQISTVTPCPSFVSSTITSTVTSLPPGANAAPPTCDGTTLKATTTQAIPAYASTACTGSVSARFASACSCNGVGPTTVTLDRSTITPTSYVTSPMECTATASYVIQGVFGSETYTQTCGSLTNGGVIAITTVANAAACASYLAAPPLPSGEVGAYGLGNFEIDNGGCTAIGSTGMMAVTPVPNSNFIAIATKKS